MIARGYGRLGVKLSILTMALIAVLTAGTAGIVIEIMDGFLFREMVKRGSALAVSASSPAGFSMLAEDRLGLDHLVSTIQLSQSDVLYVAITDTKGHLLAHSQLGATFEALQPASGPLLLQDQNISVRSGRCEEQACFEFSAPMRFLDKPLGTVQLGIASLTLEQSKTQARRKILLVALLALLVGCVATYFLARSITQPVARLSEGVARVTRGDYQATIAEQGRDELADLTRSFNAMTAELFSQREKLASYAENLESAYRDTVKILAAAIDARDPYTLGHSQRVAQLSLLLGQRIGLNAETLLDLEIACFLHDVGKIRIPDRILTKEGPLDSVETAQMVKHAEFGAEILGLATSLEQFVPTVLYHHERHDGQGYPAGLQHDEIPLFASIVAIADAYDAMTSSRPYRPGRSASDAIAELQRCRGTQFAPQLVDHFITVVNEHPDLQVQSSMVQA